MNKLSATMYVSFNMLLVYCILIAIIFLVFLITGIYKIIKNKTAPANIFRWGGYLFYLFILFMVLQFIDILFIVSAFYGNETATVVFGWVIIISTNFVSIIILIAIFNLASYKIEFTETVVNVYRFKKITQYYYEDITGCYLNLYHSARGGGFYFGITICFKKKEITIPKTKKAKSFLESKNIIIRSAPNEN